ncbi:MAG: carboxypeptidase-like regulatory domain-containing protein, partial [Bacteroidales bacterium]|nr:carboxypeptidase-like regulatory domain-containing protein [Bacteroidales bacterium]
MKQLQQKIKSLFLLLCCGLTPALHGQYLRGVIEEETPDGKTAPLEGVSVQWLGTQTGTYTDTAGYFSLKKVIGHRQLIVRHAGYRHDTIFIADTTKFVHLQLRIGHELHPVRIVST